MISFDNMYLQIIILLNFYYSSICLKSSDLNLYYTENAQNNLDRDCLYYFVPENGLNNQFIQYCIRFHLEEQESNNINRYHESFTFIELRQHNITSHQLLTWSAPVDIVENYQMYLDHSLSNDTLLFYNCTYPWFGSLCEYRFDYPLSSFEQQVEKSVITKSNCDIDLNTLPCYIYLQCDRTGDAGQTPGACLDWREICDGKTDCIDGGQDEEYCWLLEMNECDTETEFRCHNGLCIPLAFLQDDLKNPDCLDRTDEPYIGDYDFKLAKHDFQLNCDSDYSFRCEEHMCRPIRRAMHAVSCGDGTCVNPFSRLCSNLRTTVLKNAFITAANISNSCRIGFQCLTGITIPDASFIDDCNPSAHVRYYANLINQHCPPLIKLGPLLFGHVRFIYTNDQYQVSTTVTYNFCCYDLFSYQSTHEFTLVLFSFHRN